MWLYRDYNNFLNHDIWGNVPSEKEDKMEKFIRCEWGNEQESFSYDQVAILLKKNPQLKQQNALSNLKTIRRRKETKKVSADMQEQQSAQKPSTKAGRSHLLYCQRQQLACSILKSNWKGSLEATSRSEARATELESDSGSVKIFLPLKMRPLACL